MRVLDKLIKKKKRTGSNLNHGRECGNNVIVYRSLQKRYFAPLNNGCFQEGIPRRKGYEGEGKVGTSKQLIFEPLEKKYCIHTHNLTPRTPGYL